MKGRDREPRLRRLLRAYRCRDLPRARGGLRDWYGSSLGGEFLDAERQVLDQVLPDLFGYHLLQVGAPAQVNLVECSRISHCMVLDNGPPEPHAGAAPHCLYAEAGALPVASDSLDVLLLPHTLEFEANPHQVLREADRTLVPEGHVVVLGFNPWSLWGVWRLLTGWRQRAPWCGRFFSLTRVKDWLALLGFDTLHTRTFFFRPPVRRAGVRRRLAFLERAGQRWWPILGGGYVLVARKRVSTFTPIRPRWRAQAQFVPGRVSQAGLRREETCPPTDNDERK
jgi:SAM-dependent methyltransferase